MTAISIEIRPAEPEDLSRISEIVDNAYARYAAAMEKPPAPMLDDYSVRIARGQAFVAERQGMVIGVVILVDQDDHLLLDNVAVDPIAQGTGLGRQLVQFAESEAIRRGFNDIRLYTHIVMAENVGYYESLGWRETHRADQDGYARIFMHKRLVHRTLANSDQ